MRMRLGKSDDSSAKGSTKGNRKTLAQFPARETGKPSRNHPPPHCSGERIEFGLEIGGMVRAAHKRTRGNMPETLFQRNLTVSVEDSGFDVLDHGQMLRRRPQVLPHRQHGDIVFAEVVHRFENLILALT